MTMQINTGIFIRLDEEMGCFITGWNLNHVSGLLSIEPIVFAGARAVICTSDSTLIHPFVKSLLTNSVSFMGEFQIHVHPNWKDEKFTPKLTEAMITNTALAKAYNGLCTPRGYTTVNPFDPSYVDVFTFDNPSKDKSVVSVSEYVAKGKRLFRNTFPNEWRG